MKALATGMTILIVGATGATGRRLADQLLDRGLPVRAIVRSPDSLPEALQNHPHLTVITGSILDMDDDLLREAVRGCAAVVSCLGHNLTWKGLFGKPHRLVTEATRRLCLAVKATGPQRPVKFVLMNTAGNRHRGLEERLPAQERLVRSLLRMGLPPQRDNEEAAEFLRTQRPQGPEIEWVVVRPDSLTNEPEVFPYAVFESPTRSAIFNPGKTSRIQVAHFMAELIVDPALWDQWKGRMPVLYDAEDRHSV